MTKFIGKDGKPFELPGDVDQAAFVEGGFYGSGTTTFDLLGESELRSLLKWIAIAHPGVPENEALDLKDWPGWQVSFAAHHRRVNSAGATTRELMALLKLR